MWLEKELGGDGQRARDGSWAGEARAHARCESTALRARVAREMRGGGTSVAEGLAVLGGAVSVDPAQHLVDGLGVARADVQLHLVDLAVLAVDSVPPVEALVVEVLLDLDLVVDGGPHGAQRAPRGGCGRRRHARRERRLQAEREERGRRQVGHPVSDGAAELLARSFRKGIITWTVHGG